MSAARIAFRVDSSLAMGAGHVMRCLSLADELRRSGGECIFITRPAPGGLQDRIESRGHGLVLLPAQDAPGDLRGRAGADWLGVDWALDAEQTRAALPAAGLDWLVVDHYGIDSRWESRLADRCDRLMAIDDLADRDHHCQLLLDQTLDRQVADYAARVSPDCRLLVGARFALLRAQFAALREASLAQRRQPRLRRLLVSMGGTDLPNLTARVLDALESVSAPQLERVTVVIGRDSPWGEQLRARIAGMRATVELRTEVAEMAELMAASDFAIGSAGTSAWERCCLGVPGVMFVAADNQRRVAAALAACGAAAVLDTDDAGFAALTGLLHRLQDEPSALARMSNAAAGVTDGLGVARVREVLLG